MKFNILCYQKNKKVLHIELITSVENLVEQIKNKLIMYRNKNGYSEIIYLDKYDRIVVDYNGYLWDKIWKEI